MTFPYGSFRHTVEVETLLGQGARGPQYEAAAQVACYRDEAVKQVRTSSGEESVSTSTLYAAASDYSRFTVGSKVTLPDGQPALVLTSTLRTPGAINLPPIVEVALS